MSEIRTDTISAANGTDPVTLTKQSAAKAWVNFAGSGSIAVRESFNISTLTDQGAGDYLANLSNAMSSSNYGGSAAGATSGNVGFDDAAANTSSALSLGGFGGSANRTDLATVAGNTFGDLA